jgi:hypothetical protein
MRSWNLTEPDTRVSAVVGIFAPLDDAPSRYIPSERATLMLSMSLQAFGPVAALVLAVLYVIERGPIIGVRWLWFFTKVEEYQRDRRGR